MMQRSRTIIAFCERFFRVASKVRSRTTTAAALSKTFSTPDQNDALRLPWKSFLIPNTAICLGLPRGARGAGGSRQLTSTTGLASQAAGQVQHRE